MPDIYFYNASPRLQVAYVFYDNKKFKIEIDVYFRSISVKPDYNSYDFTSFEHDRSEDKRYIMDKLFSYKFKTWEL
jgi:hypothetical protein